MFELFASDKVKFIITTLIIKFDAVFFGLFAVFLYVKFNLSALKH